MPYANEHSRSFSITKPLGLRRELCWNSAVNVLIGRGSEEPELGSYEAELMLANNEGFATLR